MASSRLASLGTLAAGIAHEVNNPIGGMLNAVHRLAQNPDLQPRDRQYLELVRDGLERVARTTRKVLARMLQQRSGEGYVFDFTGPGRVLAQSRNPSGLISYLTANMPGSRA